MSPRCTLSVALTLILAAGVTHAVAQKKEPAAKSLFGAAPANTPRDNILGMSPETVGAIAYVSLAPATASSLRSRSGTLQRMQIALPGGGSVTCALRAENRPGGLVLLRGTPVGADAGGRCNLVVGNGQVTGEIDIASRRYAIVPLGSPTAQAVVGVKTEEFPNELTMEVGPDEKRHDRVAPASDQLCDVKPRPGQRPKAFGPLRVMIVYTPAARSGTANIRAEIELIVNQMREAFSLERTGGNFSIAVELAYAGEVKYTEAELGVDIRRLTDSDDPVFWRIHALRDQYRADVVHMLIKKQPRAGCGVGWLNLFLRADRAFSLSDRQCAVGNFSAVHEVGHSLGLAHDRYVTPEDKQRPGDFNFGFAAVEQRFRTIMAYPDQCLDMTKKGCPRVLYFSSPNVQHNDVAIGRPLSDPEAAYNVEQLCRAAPVATGFR